VNAGADVNIRNENGITAKDMAINLNWKLVEDDVRVKRDQKFRAKYRRHMSLNLSLSDDLDSGDDSDNTSMAFQEPWGWFHE